MPCRGGVVAGEDEDLPADSCRKAVAWLAVGAPATPPVELILLLGLAEDHDAADELSAGLLSTADELAAFLGLRRRQVESASELAAAHAEAEALGRLEHLRGRLAAVTAHELRTPLSSIVAYTEVLRERADDPGFVQRAEFLGIIREEADRLARMVERLLDFSRRPPGLPLMRHQPCDIPALLADALRILAPQAVRRHQVVTCRATANLPPVDGDPDLLRQVFLNLVGNALKFSAPGAGVTVIAREDAAMVRVAVVDRGPGIPAGELRAIFQSFYRAHGGDDVSGKGLGLSIVKDIVDLTRGTWTCAAGTVAAAPSASSCPRSTIGCGTPIPSRSPGPTPRPSRRSAATVCASPPNSPAPGLRRCACATATVRVWRRRRARACRRRRRTAASRARRRRSRPRCGARWSPCLPARRRCPGR